MSIGKVIEFIKQNRYQFVSELFDFAQIQSVSNDSRFKEQTRSAAEETASFLKKIGATKVELKETPGHPLVYGEMMNDPSKPTFMVYGHYDVQPAVKADGWETDPFEPVIKENFIYGRGVADDKGKMMVPMNAIRAFVATKTELPVNFKFLIEGEEECGEENTANFVRSNAELLKCDAIWICDTPWILPDFPSVTYSIRGIATWQVDVIGPNRDLHSGIYGGKVRNPLQAACYMVSKLRDQDGKILIPGFYDDVQPLTEETKKQFAALPFREDDIKKDAGVDELWGEKGFTAIERNWARPAIDLNGIWGGYTGEGSKTIIPSSCHFKVSTRLVGNQDIHKIDKAFHEYMRKIKPSGVTIKVTTGHKAAPMMVPVDNKYLKCMAAGIEAGFGKKAALIGNGASIPITSTFVDVLKAPCLLFDLNVPDENIHGPNEKLDLNVFHNGIKAAAHFLDLLKSC